MSTPSIRKHLSEELLRFASKEENDLIRGQINARPQVVFLTDLKWLDDTILEMMERESSSMPKRRFRRYDTSKNLARAKVLAKKKHDNYIKLNKLPGSKLNDIMETHVGQRIAFDSPEIMAMIERGDAYVVGSFATAGELKKEIVTELVTRKSQKAYAKEIASKTDRGHGAGTGVPVAGLTAARGAEAVGSNLTPEQKKEFDNYIRQNVNGLLQSGEITGAEASMIESVIVDYQTIVDSKGNIQAEYVPYITYQDKYTNRKVDAPRERFIKDTLFKFFNQFVDEELVNMEGSDSLKTLATKTVMDSLVKADKKSKNIRVQLEGKAVGAKKLGKGKANSKKKSVKKSRITKNKKAPVKKLTKAKKTFTNNPLVMIAQLNKNLPDTVKKNMGAPGLVNRSGQFAESVKVTEMVETPQGYPSIGYTYDKNPYQVFEMGSGDSRWSTPERDPRTIIDRSIREVARDLAIGRFYTRRI